MTDVVSPKERNDCVIIQVFSLIFVNFFFLRCLGGTPAGYQLLTPAYYDQSGQIFMNNGRQLGHVVRLVSPGPPTVLMTGQQGREAS